MLKCSQSGSRLSVSLDGEIDHCTASALRRDIETILRDPKIESLHLDFTNVSFIDSSGIGMIIGRYKTMIARGGSISAGGLNESVNRLFHMAGLHRIIPIISAGGQYEHK